MSLLEIDGRATFSALNAKKEGKGDSKILTVDLKLNMLTSNEVLIHFHPQLRVMLFDKDNMPRFPLMGAVPWGYEFPNQYVEIHPDVQRPLLLHACRLKNFDFFAMDGGKVRLGFSVHVRPSDGDFEIMGKILAEAVTLKVRNDNMDLFGEKPKATPQRATAEPQLTLEDTEKAVHIAAAIALITSTRKTSISYVQRQLKLTYNATAQLLEELERIGIVSPMKENGVREVLAHAPAETPPAVDKVVEGPDLVPAFNPAGTPLGMKLDKRKHLVGTTYEDGGVVYDITGQGENSITLSARMPGAPAEEPPPPPMELTDAVLSAMKAAGQAEAKKEDEDRDFDTGFATACREGSLPKDFIEENLVELQAAFADGFESPADEEATS